MSGSDSNSNEHHLGYEQQHPSDTSKSYHEKTSASDSSVDSHEETSSSNSDAPLQTAGDVEAVVDKAKKAATFLWTMLHAQVCTISAGRCPHKGCAESKLLLLHIKTCPAASGENICPKGHNGCHQARKLLAHYRKCREIRAKQRRSRSKQQQLQTNVCLICTLLHRHDKSISDNALSISSPFPPTSSSTIIRKNKARSKSVSFDFDLRKESKVPDSPLAMPPPPPRSKTSISPSISSLTSSFSKVHPILVNKNYRPRAESYDERSSRSPKTQIDPIVELEFLKARKGSMTEVDISEHDDGHQLPFRKRSVSCGILSSKPSTGMQSVNCETIMEES